MENFLIVLFAVCVATSFFLSGMESGVFALSRLRIRHRMRMGNPRAAVLYSYLENPEDFLWTIFVGNTLAWFTAISIGLIGAFRFGEPWPGFFWAAALVGILAYYAFCELLPKMLFRLHPNRLCLALVPVFRFVYLAVRPMVLLVSWLARWLLKWSGGRKFTGNLFGNREELRFVMQESSKGFTSEERAMISRVLDLQHLTVEQTMIPLGATVSVERDAPMRQCLDLLRDRGVGWVPVWNREAGSRRITGIVDLRSMLYHKGPDPEKTAGDFVKPALFINKDVRLEVALRQMQRAGQRLSIVLGADGKELGIVSLQDILEVIFGEVHL